MQHFLYGSTPTPFLSFSLCFLPRRISGLPKICHSEYSQQAISLLYWLCYFSKEALRPGMVGQSIIPALRKHSQKNHSKFETSKGYKARLCVIQPEAKAIQLANNNRIQHKLQRPKYKENLGTVVKSRALGR